MRYKQFLNESRSNSISEEKAIKLIKSNCKDALKGIINIERNLVYKDRGTIIYRGVYNNNDFLYINPKQGSLRKSANTSNYYTLLMDNNSEWKNYPKRSQSIICSTSGSIASTYGVLFIVLPYDNGKIGVCPSDDLWSSFSNSEIFLSLFNRKLKKLFTYLNIPFKDDSIESIRNAFNEFDKEVNENEDYFFEILSKSDVSSEWIREYIDFFDMDEFIRYKLDPKRNGFKLVKSGDQIKCKNCEVWTDSRSILLKNNGYNRELIATIKKSL